MLENQLRRVTTILGKMRLLPGRLSLGSDHSIAPATMPPAATPMLSQIVAQAAERTSIVAEVSPLPWQKHRAQDYPMWSPMLGSAGVSATANAAVGARFGLAITRLHAVILADVGRMPAREPSSEHVLAAPSFALSDYLDGDSVAERSIGSRETGGTRFAQFMQAHTTLTRKVVDFTTGPNRTLQRIVAAHSDRTGSFGIERPWSRLPGSMSNPREASTQHGSVFKMLDHPAPTPSISSAASAGPTTISVAINVQGVTNGDEFVRRQGYEIARVIEQVMQRRTRRAF
jgi:hypothetical protein